MTTTTSSVIALVPPAARGRTDAGDPPAVRAAARELARAISHALRSALRDAVRAPGRWWRRRGGLQALRELDDRMLRDVGLERADLVRAVRGFDPRL
ncbi:MAG TPA: DUF1127 domain-containing protein [Burkholderiaceae bacterium]|nr:DUF1127 domain-containing protein [Burkholderiaceae bacterium]